MIKRKKSFVVLTAIIVLLILIIIAGAAVNIINKANHPIKFQEYVEKYTIEYNLDNYLLYAFICTESGFDSEAVSNLGARGLLQITEETFVWIKSKIANDEELTFDDMFNPEISIRFGAYYIAQSLMRYENDISTAAAAYHSGWGTVDKLLKDAQYADDGQILIEFPYNQMNRYVHKINKNYNKYLKLYDNKE